MRILPVMDLCGGQVVHAVRGDRARYRPLTTTLMAGSDPGAIGRALRDIFGFDSIYVADLDAIAGRAPAEAPLMREALRVDHAIPRSPQIRIDRDLCVRALFAASGPIRAWFADDAGSSRGEIALGATGTVPPRGPVCVKKGETIYLVVEAATEAEDARAIIFAAP